MNVKYENDLEMELEYEECYVFKNIMKRCIICRIWGYSRNRMKMEK